MKENYQWVSFNTQLQTFSREALIQCSASFFRAIGKKVSPQGAVANTKEDVIPGLPSTLNHHPGRFHAETSEWRAGKGKSGVVRLYALLP
ncbi:hypothetical protein AGMMS50256_34900 [Betaproteobacteria bacterium]|nr:hypothetical protein AGMMS50256_34900 [Betaproteobacteria bacterium]